MVSSFSKKNRIKQLVLMPNRSLGWKGNLRVILALAILITIAAAPGVFLGAWVIIPFALIQMAMVTTCLYLTLKKLEYHEVITLESGNVCLQRGDACHETRATFPQESVNIIIEEHHLPMSLPDIDFIADGHCYPIGEFLNRDDRSKMVSILKNQLNLRISHLNSFQRISF